ncbi:MAG: tetratricopeptide repeat protein [Planctomycetes bacterium]|nr:tetratricopeptide repeat protein [Planctomycetota bacterium]
MNEVRNKDSFVASKVELSVVLLFVICAAVAIVHWPALSARARSFDDDQYFIDNRIVQNPSWTSTWRFFSEVLEPSVVEGYYQPITMVSLMVDYALGGRENNLLPFHRTSLVLHTANTALIIVLLYMLLGHIWTAAGVGLLFGVHPITAELICWVSDRKDLLAMFFTLWSLIFYVKFASSRNWKFYIVCIAMYLLALMSKPTAIPLPVLLLLLDYWPLKRLKWQTLLEKLPLFIMAGVFALITYISQSRMAFTKLPSEYGFERIPLVLCHNIILYLYKIFWPVNLTLFYEYPEPLALSHPMVLTGVIGTCVLICTLLVLLRWTRAPLTGWLVFFVAIFPTMGMIGFTYVIAADRYVYLPSIGLLMILAAFFGRLVGKANPKLTVVLTVVLILAGAEAVATRQYLVHWQEPMSIYKHILSLSPNSVSVHNNLGNMFQSQDKLDEAVTHFRKVLEMKPDHTKARYNLANALRLQGKSTEAIEHYRLALRGKSSDADAYNNMGIALQAEGKIDEAISSYHQALRTKLDHAGAHNNLGMVFQLQGLIDEAVSHYRQALESDPYFAEAYYNLGTVFQSQNKLDQAISYYHQSLRFEPDRAEVHNNLGMALRAQGKLDQAVESFQQALKINPDHTKAHGNLGVALQSQGKFDEAISQFHRAIEANPNNAKTHFNLAMTLIRTDQVDKSLEHLRQAASLKPDWPAPLANLALILATHPNPKLRNASQAVTFGERAAKLTNYQDAYILDTLAEAYAAAGQFKNAATTAQKAIDRATALGNHQLANQTRKRLELYKKKKL